jgi:hypothetical protein
MKTGKSIVPAPTVGRPLTRAQERFRDLLARVESLRKSIDSEEEALDTALTFYAAEIAPRLTAKTFLQKELVRTLAPCLNQTFFSNRRQRMDFREFAQELLDEIAKQEKGLTDPDLREIYSAVNGVNYTDYERKTLATLKENLAHTFAEAGLEADFSELDRACTEAEFMAKAEELLARARKMKEAEAATCAEHGHHATADEELRAAEEARKRSIANIYKQLARVLHPDLERDSKRQKEKVELMQELTVAFKQNDLHTLLRLEMEWIEHEGDNIERLTQEKLELYNDVLRDQAEGLEKRRRNLLFHARYKPVVEFNLGITSVINGPDKARELDASIAAMQRSNALMKEARTAGDVRAALAPLRPAQQEP